MEEVFKIVNLFLNFDLRDSPNGETYSLIQAAYLKQIQNDGTLLTQDDEIAARRLSRAFLIVCVVSFMESCSSVDFYIALHNQFIDSVGESKLGDLKPLLVNESYVKFYQVCSSRLAENNGGQDIKSLVEAIGSAHRAKLESAEGLDNEDGIERIINYLEE
jgi:hypothetical protein|tara:strand:- start:720 stop:1202 length:483 start_codon:yes stop_codon:yes gene_type:complete